MFSFADSLQGMHENRLLNELLDKYNPLERPVAIESEALNVTFGLTLQQIIDVVSTQKMTNKLIPQPAIISVVSEQPKLSERRIPWKKIFPSTTFFFFFFWCMWQLFNPALAECHTSH